MPQLDFYSLSNQFFWGLLFFGIFYYVVLVFFIPAFFSLLFARKTFNQELTNTSYNLIAYVFILHASISLSSDELFTNMSMLIGHLKFSRVIAYAAMLESFNVDYNEVTIDDFIE